MINNIINFYRLRKLKKYLEYLKNNEEIGNYTIEQYSNNRCDVTIRIKSKTINIFNIYYQYIDLPYFKKRIVYELTIRNKRFNMNWIRY